MGELRLYDKEIIRVTNNYKGDVFIDVETLKGVQGLGVQFYPSMQYVEIRKKEGFYKQFMFPNKRSKKYFDFGYWDDADVIFSINEVTQ